MLDGPTSAQTLSGDKKREKTALRNFGDLKRKGGREALRETSKVLVQKKT